MHQCKYKSDDTKSESLFMYIACEGEYKKKPSRYKFNGRLRTRGGSGCIKGVNILPFWWGCHQAELEG